MGTRALKQGLLRTKLWHPAYSGYYKVWNYLIDDLTTKTISVLFQKQYFKNGSLSSTAILFPHLMVNFLRKMLILTI